VLQQARGTTIARKSHRKFDPKMDAINLPNGRMTRSHLCNHNKVFSGLDITSNTFVFPFLVQRIMNSGHVVVLLLTYDLVVRNLMWRIPCGNIELVRPFLVEVSS